jgi:hypothetical protein
MSTGSIIRRGGLALALVGLAAAAVQAARERPALADQVEGDYRGVLGAGRGDVIVTVTRLAANRIRLMSSHPDLPGGDVRIEMAMGRIVQAAGAASLSFDPTHAPMTLDYSWGPSVMFSGVRV